MNRTSIALIIVLIALHLNAIGQIINNDFETDQHNKKQAAKTIIDRDAAKDLASNAADRAARAAEKALVATERYNDSKAIAIEKRRAAEQSVKDSTIALETKTDAKKVAQAAEDEAKTDSLAALAANEHAIVTKEAAADSAAAASTLAIIPGNRNCRNQLY